MNSKIDWLANGGNRVLKVEMPVHHAPMYFTLFDENIIELSFDIDYPSTEDSLLITVPDVDSLEKRVENGKSIEKVTIDESPFVEVKDKQEPVISSNRAVRMKLPTVEEEFTVQDVVQLQNGKYLSISRRPEFLIGVSRSKVQEKLEDNSVETQLVPRKSVGIPYNPLTCSPDEPSLKQNGLSLK